MTPHADDAGNGLKRAVLGFAHGIAGWLADKTPIILYGGCCALTLVPAFDMLRSGNILGAFGHLGFLGATVGGNLIANEMQKWAEETDPIRAAAPRLAQLAQQDEYVRTQFAKRMADMGVLKGIYDALTSSHAKAFAQGLTGDFRALGLGSPIFIAGDNLGIANSGIQFIDSLTITNNRYGGPDPRDVAEARQIYLALLAGMVSRLPMKAFDANQSNPHAHTSDLSLMSVYTSLDTRETVAISPNDTRRYARPIPELDRLRPLEERDRRPLRALEAVAGSRHLALLGDPGSGKSSFVNHLIYCLAQPRAATDGDWRDAFEQDWPVAERDALPIRIILRDFAAWLDTEAGQGDASVARVTAFIAHTLVEQNIPLAQDVLDALVKALQSGNALVILDGLDEVTTHKKRIFVRDIVAALKERYGKSRIVVTCRTGSYLPPENRYVEDLRIASFPKAELAPFDDVKIKEFIDAWHAELTHNGQLDKAKADMLRPKLQAAVRGRDLHRLATNPLQLTLMAWVHTHDEELPTNRAALYDKAVELHLWALERTKKTGSHPELQQLAAKIDNGKTRIERELWRAAFDAHAGMPLDTSEKERDKLADVNESALKTALSRLKDDELNKPDLNWARDVVDALRFRSGLLNQRLDNVLTFPHRTFQEYLAGLWLLQQTDISDQVFRLAAQLETWREVVLLAVGHTVFVQKRLNLSEPLALVSSLCPVALLDDDTSWKRVWLAGDILCECGIKLVQEGERSRALFDAVRAGLRHLVEGHKLTPPERARAADTLARMADSRFDPTRYDLPAGDELGFVKIEADPGFKIGTRSKDVDRIARELRADRDWLAREINDETTPTEAFYIARYPVTVAQFRAFVSATNVKLGDPDALLDPDTRPVRWVSWHEAMTYAEWLNAQIRDAPGLAQTPISGLLRSGKWRLTLPTEREWEKAARGGRVNANYSWGDTPDPTLANYADSGINMTSAVGAFRPNDFGLFDMLGNVWEWTRSWHRPYDKKHDKGRPAGTPEAKRAPIDATRIASR